MNNQQGSTKTDAASNNMEGAASEVIPDLLHGARKTLIWRGIIFMIFGVLIIISPDYVQPAIPYTIGMYVLLDGLLKLQTAFDARAFGMKQWWGLLTSSALVSLVGILVLLGLGVIAPARILFGIALALDGAENVWNTLATVRVRAKQNGRFEDLL